MTAELVEFSNNNYKIFVDKNLSQDINKSWFTPAYWQSNQSIVGQSKGRNTAYFINHSNLKMVLRRYYRGGLMAKLSKEHYLFSGYQSARASAELSMLNDMLKLGLPVPRPIAALVEKRAMLWCKNAILIERIEGATDGYQSLLENPWSSDIWQRLGIMIKKFHDRGVYHSDMNIHNILIDHNEVFWMIDFDKCCFKENDEQWQQQTLSRLNRSLLKEKSKHQEFHFQDDDWQSLLIGYERSN